MNKKQSNRKHMVEATLSFLDGNASVWQSIAKIGEVKNQLNDVNQAIDAAAVDQQQAQLSIGKIKLGQKRTVSEKADIMNDILEVFAEMNGNQELAQTMSDSASDLLQMSYDDMLRKVKLIIDAATENQEALVAEYGLTAEQIADLQADYDRLRELNGQPREYQIKSGVATLTLEELFIQVNTLLGSQLDNLMKLFKRRDPNFYNGYQKARMVVDY